MIILSKRSHRGLHSRRPAAVVPHQSDAESGGRTATVIKPSRGAEGNGTDSLAEGKAQALPVRNCLALLPTRQAVATPGRGHRQATSLFTAGTLADFGGRSRAASSAVNANANERGPNSRRSQRGADSCAASSDVASPYTPTGHGAPRARAAETAKPRLSPGKSCALRDPGCFVTCRGLRGGTMKTIGSQYEHGPILLTAGTHRKSSQRPRWLKTRKGGGSNSIACPICARTASAVIDSRVSIDGSCRRRRVCSHCDARFTTYERVAHESGIDYQI